MRFDRDVNKVLISGGVRNPQELTNTPALVDSPYGEGHVVMFSFNPFWRGETEGAYALVFNTLMHYRNLAPARRPAEVATGESGTN